MQRCIDLARRGEGHVAPNPMVGAVLVHQDRIIGEGFHQEFGGPHAEVNCINAVDPSDAALISGSTMYVSLEPCAHFGKTPPCADLILRHRIPRVIVGCRDPFEAVNGKGIEKLIAGGVDVQSGVMEEECVELNKRFFTYHLHGRPYVLLKWAETADGFIAPATGERLHISRGPANQLVHQWRSQESAILVGTNTALMDDPQLTTRHWPGPNPVRVVIDRRLRLPRSLRLFDSAAPTIVFNDLRAGEDQHVRYYQLNEREALVPQLLAGLHRLGLLSVMVEGGRELLRSFFDSGMWDEARIITNPDVAIGEGLTAPNLSGATKAASYKVRRDLVSIFRHRPANYP